MNVFSKNVQMNDVSVKLYQKKQISIIGRSSLYAGLGFLLTSLFSFLFSSIPLNPPFDVIIMVGSLLIAMGLTFYVSFKTTEVSYLIYGLLYLFYCIASGFTFNAIFSLFNGQELLLIFGLAGGILTIAGIVGLLIPEKLAMNLMKFAFILFGIYMLLTLVLVLFYFLIPGSFSNPLFFGISIISGLLSILYIVITFNSMSKTQMFIDQSGTELDKDVINKMCLFFGFILLTSVINLIILLARLFTIIR